MEEQTTESPVVHNLNGNNANTFTLPRFLTLLVVIVVFGVVTGFIFSKLQSAGGTASSQSQDNVQKTAGIAGKKNFKDKAEGVLQEGGIDGEGNFHLKRPGGESQNVYLTSTTVDLSEYVGKKVRVWGETFEGEKAGWLMDVGLVEILQ
ncbi:hypothetical protein HYW87_03165 [Candidatus Roizmanbacteria bacterium]|nr:hypothetical protein [Candidatus Roizmanbacteria bacterium]